MVMSADPEEQVQTEQLDMPVDAPDTEDITDTTDVAEDVSEPSIDAVAPQAPVDTPQADALVEEPPTIGPEQSDQIASHMEELQRMRQANAQKEWEQQVLKSAQAMERRALEQGTDTQSARQMARQHIGHQKALREQDTKARDVIGFYEGRNKAAMHYAIKHKLVDKKAVEDLLALTSARTPQEMEKEAKRMSQMRSQSAEIARLKQGRVAPQTFDNSQGAAEATSNDNRLLDAYNAGDRSEAAIRAARRLALGS